MLPGDVHDVVVLEAAHHVRDRVDFADMRQKLIAQALALRGAGHQARDIDELHRGRQIFSGCTIAASCSSRASGTGTTPTFGSMVQNG